MHPLFLSQPIGAIMRPTALLERVDSLELAARRLRENGAVLIPIADGYRFVGVVTEGSLAVALAEGCQPSDPVERARCVETLTVSPYATGAEALRLFGEHRTPGLVVIDDQERVLGILTPSDLYPKYTPPLRPSAIGGMATPFGVYLTNGSIRAGASHLALMTTGMLLFLLLLVATYAGEGATWLVQSRGGTGSLTELAGLAAFFGVFVLIMKALPLSGIHAAEHKVVHAIERGEELTPDIVRRMPRVHPRCGTNIAAGAMLFTLVGSLQWDRFLGPEGQPELRWLVAGIVTLVFWRPLGALVQRFVTTREPSEKQLLSGIRTGQEMLDKYSSTRVAYPGFFARLVNSGVFHVMAGGAICHAVASGVAYLLKVELPL